jgi:anaerobic ribonucleoside-triphosphate reductase activating protein
MDNLRYSGIIKNDMAAAPGISVTFFTQGCPHHCSGCQNPETWDFKGGMKFTKEVYQEVIDALKENGIYRSLSIMGGEPLCEENVPLTLSLIKNVRKELPEIQVYIWTGYTLEELINRNDVMVRTILRLADYLIDGPFILEERDITLPMCGSRNQRVINLNEVHI